MDSRLLTKEDAAQLLNTQKEFFKQGKTRPYAYRIEQLERLYQAILLAKSEVEQALEMDLGKSKFESYVSEIGFTLASITRTKKLLKRWMRPARVSTPISLFPASSRVERVPYGVVFIMGPYNYPFQLLIEPLLGAIAAGNCAVLSPSELTPNVAAVVKKLIGSTFNEEYVCCIDGGIENNNVLLHSRFDYIFFTGSVQVGKIVMKAASEHLIPVTLELGGKSPLIVDHTTRLRTACERIVWGKLINAGQTCVAPDYVFVDERIQEAFIQELIDTIHRFYGPDIQKNPDFGRIVNRRHMERLKRILDQDKAFIRFGGETDDAERFIEPTILCPDSFEAASMQEELFGPILPVFPYKELTNVLDYINRHETPLALYVFSEEDRFIQTVLQNTVSGGVSVNDVISHIANPDLPFGGMGSSGMGTYHGRESFNTFTHQRSILKRSTAMRIPVAFPHFTSQKLKIVKQLLK